MSILDIFKKSSDVKEEKVDLQENNINNENEEHINIDVNLDEVDTLTGERCNELISHVLKDKDFGEEYIKTTNIRENIFIIAYMRNTLLKKFEGDSINDLHNKLLKTIETFEDMVFERVMKLDKLWKVINKATGCPIIDNQEEHILISDMYKDNMIAEFKKLGIIAEAVEINHEQFLDELNDLYRTGYKGMRFTDGRQTPCVLKRERMLDSSKVKKLEYPTNPETYFSLVAYLQEFRRGVAKEGENKALNMLGRSMIINLLKTKFIIPVQKRGENQFNLPIYRCGQDENDTSIGLYIFTDEIEMHKINMTGIRLGDDWKAQVDEFKDVIDKVEQCHISEICVNFANMQFRIDRNTLNSLKKDAGIVSKEDELKLKQQKFEAEELPKIFNKEISIVNAPNGLPVFMREENRICINNYLINVLVMKDMINDAMNSFIEDEHVDIIKVFDVQTREADIIVKENQDKTGIFIMPMKYTDEKDKEEINDDTIYYSVNAANIESNKEQDIKLCDKEINLYTIVNSGNKKTYLPLFNSVEEVHKIFPKNKFRLCKVTYDDIKEELNLYDGVVIGPTTLNAIIPKEIASKILDINM